MDDNQFPFNQKKFAAKYEKIERRHFKDTEPVVRPLCVILGGQPGAGKSGLLEASKQDFIDRNVVMINGDELRYYHPNYLNILKTDERQFAELTDPYARPWTKQLFDRTIETRRNVVFEGTMREVGPITDTMRRLQDADYYVVARVIAAHENDSMAGIHRRYEEQKAAKGFGRWSNIQAHNDAYNGMPATVGYIEQNKLADCVEVYDRQGRVIYQNELQQNEWQKLPMARAAIERERQRPRTLEERQKQDVEWNTILAMMTARRADVNEIEKVREVSRQYGGLQNYEVKAVEYAQQGFEARFAEAGKKYVGVIVSVDDKHVIQSVKEAGHEVHIQHERLVLTTSKNELIKVGAKVEIKYPYNRIAIVKEWGVKEMQGKATTGLKFKGYGEL